MPTKRINLGSPCAFAGHLLSILAMIRSASAMASAMADSSAGEGRPSQFANFLAARIPATIASTRLSLRSASLPSTMEELGYLQRSVQSRIRSGGQSGSCAAIRGKLRDDRH